MWKLRPLDNVYALRTLHRLRVNSNSYSGNSLRLPVYDSLLKQKAALKSDLCLRKVVLPTLDNLRNFFLTPTTEVLSFFQTR